MIQREMHDILSHHLGANEVPGDLSLDHERVDFAFCSVIIGLHTFVVQVGEQARSILLKTMYYSLYICISRPLVFNLLNERFQSFFCLRCAYALFKGCIYAHVISIFFPRFLEKIVKFHSLSACFLALTHDLF